MSPEVDHQPLPGHDHAGTAGEIVQQVELLAGEFDCPPVESDLPGFAVEAETAPGEQGSALTAEPPHDGVDARYQFTKGIGPLKTVVGPGLQAENSVEFGSFFGEGYDRRVTGGSNATADLDTVNIGQPEIEQHQIDIFEYIQGFRAGTHRDGVVTMPSQAIYQ